jgi:hypothetical protein
MKKLKTNHHLLEKMIRTMSKGYYLDFSDYHVDHTQMDDNNDHTEKNEKNDYSNPNGKRKIKLIKK